MLSPLFLGSSVRYYISTFISEWTIRNISMYVGITTMVLHLNTLAAILDLGVSFGCHCRFVWDA